MKTMVAAVCVVAAGMGGLNAYNAANQSEADMLLAENVEALSQGEISTNGVVCPKGQRPIVIRTRTIEVRDYEWKDKKVKEDAEYEYYTHEIGYDLIGYDDDWDFKCVPKDSPEQSEEIRRTSDYVSALCTSPDQLGPKPNDFRVKKNKKRTF